MIYLSFFGCISESQENMPYSNALHSNDDIGIKN
jgi:hypothetical protein